MPPAPYVAHRRSRSPAPDIRWGRSMAVEVLSLLTELRAITATPGRGCTRLAYTPLESEAHGLVWSHFARRGFVRLGDAAGNMFVLPEAVASDAATSPVVLVGSHLDTVIEGGWLDGALGVALGARVVDALAPKGRRVGLVVFRDEEGVRFGTGLFGSKVFAGLCTEADLAATDAEGERLADLVPDAAGCLQYQRPVRPAAYLECHIEQGLRLIERGRRAAGVSGIVGIRRVELVGTGAANHAGTTEMHRRVDALVPVAEIVARLPSLVADLPEAVITCGRMLVLPGAPNIVPGEVRATVEIRDCRTSTMDLVERRLRDLASAVRPATARSRMAQVRITPVVEIPPAPTDAGLNAVLAEVLTEHGLPVEQLPSMAGHDAQHVARVCPTGMLFIPSIGGVSHHPAEDSDPKDILLAATLMTAWAERAAATCSSS
jgi:hydantoinase/carbamoylase family amidase